MDNRLLIVLLSAILVYIVIRIYFAGKSGMSVRDILSGKRPSDGKERRRSPKTVVSNFAGKKDEAEEAEDKSSSENGEKGAAVTKKRKGQGKSGAEKNSTADEMIRAINDVVKFAKKNRFYVIFPGTLKVNGRIEVLSAILITRAEIIGIACYGYGGSVFAKDGDEDWVQVINGEKSTFKSPVVKNREKLSFLKEAIKAAGLEECRCYVSGVFTAPAVRLEGAKNSGCYTTSGFLSYLSTIRFAGDNSIYIPQTAMALEKLVYREKDEEKNKNRKKGKGRA